MTSDTVYWYARKQQAKGVLAAKGSSDDYGSREIFATPRRVDHKREGTKTKADKHGLQVHIVGTHKAKDLLFSDKGRLSLHGSGPGRMHWYRDVRADFYEQITAEVRVPSKRLRGKMEWQKKAGVRNEGTDCAVLALHAARSLRLHTWPESRWQERESALKQADLFTAPVEQEQQHVLPKPAGQSRSGDFIGIDTGAEWIT
jgi:phage terminase large subunit GpA-like protein